MTRVTCRLTVKTRIGSGTLHSVDEYGLALVLYLYLLCSNAANHLPMVVAMNHIVDTWPAVVMTTARPVS